MPHFLLKRLLRVYVISSFSAKTTEEEHADQGNYPCIALVEVHHIVPNNARDEGAHANDDDSNDGRKSARVDVGQRLTSEDDSRCGKAKPEQFSAKYENNEGE